AAGTTLTIDSGDVSGGKTFTFDGSGETDGAFNINAGSGQAVLTGGGGNDVFSFAGGFRVSDRLDGGIGINDILSLAGDYSAGLVFQDDTIRNIESVLLAAGHSYNLTLDNANVTIGNFLTVDGNTLGTSDVLVFDGSDEMSSRL